MKYFFSHFIVANSFVLDGLLDGCLYGGDFVQILVHSGKYLSENFNLMNIELDHDVI